MDSPLFLRAVLRRYHKKVYAKAKNIIRVARIKPKRFHHKGFEISDTYETNCGKAT